MLAFMMTAFTSLGGLASRADKVVSERQDVLDSRADTKTQIAALVAEKAGLKFRHATKATVDSAQLTVDAASKASKAECGDGSPKQRGPFCRGKEEAEARALTALTEAQDNKAATDRANEIDIELRRLRSIRTEGNVGAADPLKALLASILGGWADLLSSWQKAAFAVIYDLCLVALMIGIEVLGHAQPARREEPKPEPAPEPVVQPVQLKPAAARPKLVVTNSELVVTLVPLLQKIAGPRSSIVEVHKAYTARCREQSPETTRRQGVRDSAGGFLPGDRHQDKDHQGHALPAGCPTRGCHAGSAGTFGKHALTANLPVSFGWCQIRLLAGKLLIWIEKLGSHQAGIQEFVNRCAPVAVLLWRCIPGAARSRPWSSNRG